MTFSTIDISQSLTIRPDGPPVLIAGVCALVDEPSTRAVAQYLTGMRDELEIPVIFKGSYAKANRTRHDSFHGVGMTQGLELLAMVKAEYSLPVTTDIHESAEADVVADVIDVLQIPALLCKQTSLVFAAGDTGKPVNVKKGQFMNAADMEFVAEKIRSRGNDKVILTERGTLFGYGDTINDFRGIQTMRRMGLPVIFDATHSVRVMSERSDSPCGAKPEFMPLLCRCAAAAGASGLFVETFEEPRDAPCDATCCVNLDTMKRLAQEFTDFLYAARSIAAEDRFPIT